MATGLHIRSGITLDKFTNEFSSSYALSYDPTSGQIGYMGTGSFTSGYLTLDNTGSFITNAMTASMLSPYTLNSQTGSFVTNSKTGSFLTTGSSGNTQTVSGSLSIAQNLTVLGTASFQYVTTVYETASVIYSSGSNQFGDATNDTQTLIGTVRISGSLEVTASTITLNIPSKSSGYVLQSDSNGNATWVNPTTLTTANPTQMATGSVTASVNIGSTDIFKIVSGSSTLLSITGSTRHLSISGGIALHSGIPYASTFGGGVDGVIQTFVVPSTYKTQMVFRPSGNIVSFASYWYSRLEQDGNRFKMLSQYPINCIGHIDNNGGTNVIGYKDGVSGNHGLVVTSLASTATSTNYGQLIVSASGVVGTNPVFRIVSQSIDYFNINANGQTTISGSLLLSGSSLQFRLPSAASGYVLQSDGSGNATWVSPGSVAVFPYSGNAQITGSLAISGSGGLNVTGSLGINGSLTENIVTGSLGAGTTTIFQRDTGSFTSALAKYTVNKSTNARAGEFMTVWNGNQIVNADISTTDIGSTSEVTFTSSLVNGQIQTNVVTTTSGWNVKMLITYL